MAEKKGRKGKAGGGRGCGRRTRCRHLVCTSGTLGKREREPDAAKAHLCAGTYRRARRPCHHRSPRSTSPTGRGENCRAGIESRPPRPSSVRVPASAAGLSLSPRGRAQRATSESAAAAAQVRPRYRRLSRGRDSRSLAPLRSRATAPSCNTDRHVSCRGGSQRQRVGSARWRVSDAESDDDATGGSEKQRRPRPAPLSGAAGTSTAGPRKRG